MLFFSYRMCLGHYEEGKKQFMLENVFFFLSITVFHCKTNFFFLHSFLQCAAMTICPERRGEKLIVLSKNIEVNTVSVRPLFPEHQRSF